MKNGLSLPTGKGKVRQDDEGKGILTGKAVDAKQSVQIPVYDTSEAIGQSVLRQDRRH